jgi:hypothetical protein
LTSFQSVNRPSLSLGSSSRISRSKQSFSVSLARRRPPGNIHSRSRLLLTNKTGPRFAAISFDDFGIPGPFRSRTNRRRSFYSNRCAKSATAHRSRALTSTSFNSAFLGAVFRRSTGLDLVPRLLLNSVHMPANAASGRSSLSATAPLRSMNTDVFGTHTEHIGDAVHLGSDGTECAPLPRRHVISAHSYSTISEYACRFGGHLGQQHMIKWAFLCGSCRSTVLRKRFARVNAETSGGLECRSIERGVPEALTRRRRC